MEFNERLKAIQFIRPHSEFVLTGNNLIWFDEEQSEPTEAEIQAGWVGYKDKVETDKAEAFSKRAAAEAKLEALGLTPDDLKALGL